MASKFRQEMPPAGGYGNITWSKLINPRRFGGYQIFAAWLGITVVSWAGYVYGKKKDMVRQLEMREGRIAMHPLIIAERHRMFLQQLRKNRDEENELMKDVPGWVTGTLWGEPVYHNINNDFPYIHPEEYFMHNKSYDKFDRMHEKRNH